MSENKKQKLGTEPAFPNSKQCPSTGHVEYGMSLRDYLAIKAMQGICVNAGRNNHTFDRLNQIAETSYKLADAMLEERKRHES